MQVRTATVIDKGAGAPEACPLTMSKLYRSCICFSRSHSLTLATFDPSRGHGTAICTFITTQVYSYCRPERRCNEDRPEFLATLSSLQNRGAEKLGPSPSKPATADSTSHVANLYVKRGQTRFPGREPCLSPWSLQRYIGYVSNNRSQPRPIRFEKMGYILVIACFAAPAHPRVTDPKQQSFYTLQ